MIGLALKTVDATRFFMLGIKFEFQFKHTIAKYYLLFNKTSLA